MRLRVISAQVEIRRPAPFRHSRAGGNPPGPDHVGGLLERGRQTVDPGSAPGMKEKAWRFAK